MTSKFPVSNITPYSPRPFYSRVIDFEHSAPYRLTCIGLLLWWIASLYPLMAVGEVEARTREAAEATAHGSVTTRLLVLSFSLLGGIYFPRAIRTVKAHPQLRSLLYYLCGYLLWCAATLLWSDDVALSCRRLGEFLLVLLGTIGLGAGFYSQTRQGTLTIGRHALYAALIATILLFVSRLSNHSLSDLLNPEWTLKTDTALQFYAYPVGYAIISCFALWPRATVTRIVTVSVLLMVMMIMKCRSMIVGTLAAGLIIWSRLVAHITRRTVYLLAGVILLLFQLDLATGARFLLGTLNSVDSLASSSTIAYLTITNGLNDLLSLDGRVPLWQTLWSYFCERPLLGHGFGAFWNPARFALIYIEVGWPAVVAHNGFLDELLGTGLIGLCLFTLFWLRGMFFSVHVAADKRSRCLVLGWLLLFLCFNTLGSLLQSYFQAPTLFCLTALCSLLAQAKPYSSHPQYHRRGNAYVLSPIGYRSISHDI